MTTPSAHAARQYASTTGNLTARMGVHAYGTNPQGWFGWLGERLPLSGRVLEVGAGTGELWAHLPHDDLDLTLTDFSAAMCARLAGVPGASVRRCDAGALPFADGSFDTVIANHMLYHVDDPGVVLREFARVGRSGARVAVATNGRAHMAELRELGALVGRPGLVALRGFTAENGPALMAAAFDDVRVEQYPGDLAVPAPEPILAYLMSMADEPLAPSQVACVRAAVESRIAADGVFRVRKHTVLLTATIR